MWRQTIVGIVTGLAAVIAAMLVRPADRPDRPEVTMLAVTDELRGGAFHPGPDMQPSWVYPPTTRPAALAALDTVVSEFKANDLSLARFFEYLGEVTGTNIIVEWETLGQRAVFRDSTVTFQLRNVTARQLLDRALRQVAADGQPLGYHIADNVLTVTTHEDAQNFALVRIYRIRDLVERAVEEGIRQGRLDPAAAANSTPGGGTGNGIFSFTPIAKPATRGDLEDIFVVDLANLIRDTVDIDSWVENGGRFGRVQYFMGRLIVTQGAQAHAEIEALLRTLREKP